MVKTIVIAEAGVNHNGDIKMALQLVDVAAKAGADFVKFQTYSADRLVTAAAAKADYQVASTGDKESQREMLRQLELSEKAHYEIIARCKAQGIGFLSTAFDIESMNFLVGLGIPLIKIPSGEITNLPYLRHVGRLGLPTIVSTGMADMDEVGRALLTLEAGGLSRELITVLHCTTDYPTNIEDVNLLAMLQLRDTFNVKVGYSDHTIGIEVPIAAVALGACVIEKHFTLDCGLPGPDHCASLPAPMLFELVQGIRNIEKALGDGEKRPRAAEEKNKLAARKSIVAAQKIRAGESFSAANLTIKRPGNGMSPMRWDDLLGRAASRDFDVDEQIEL